MAMYPNGRYLTNSIGRAFGPGAGLENRTNSFRAKRAVFTCETYARTASVPDGYDVKGVLPAMKAGSMSAYVKPVSTMTGFASLLSGAPMIGEGSISWTSEGNVSLIVSMQGTAAVVTLATANAQLRLTIGLDGTGSIQLTSNGSLSLVVPIEGSGQISFAGAADLRGRLSMEGSWTPFSELSPENLAAAVWTALSSANNEPGTMGNKLNSAASGGVDLNALANAVRNILLQDFTELKGTGYDVNNHSLVKIKQQAALAAALSA